METGKSSSEDESEKQSYNSASSVKPLSRRQLEELKEIHTELATLDVELRISVALKKKVAKILLSLVKTSPSTKQDILSRANTIAEFVEYDFEDNLDDILAIATELTAPKSGRWSYIRARWQLMRKMLEVYLKPL